MKKMNRVLSLLIAVTLCLSQAWAERISQEDAALVANNFMNVASQNSAVKKAVPVKRMVLKTPAQQEENLFYLYENADGEGWVIIAANDAVTPILAYSETGHFRTDNMPENVRKWMGKYNNFIKKIEADGVQASEEAVEEWTELKKGVRKATAAVVVGPLIKTTWDQDAPYDLLCPGTGTWGQGNTKAAVGCVATAMAQVMKYWEWPKKGTGSHTYKPLNPNTGKSQTKYGTQTADFGNTTYDWSNMKNSYLGTYTDAQANAVATLMYHCGVATEMMYGDYAWGGSGTYTVNYLDETWGTTVSNTGGCAENALWYYFGYKKDSIHGYIRDGLEQSGTWYYKKWSDSDWTAMIKEELDKQHPIMYAGASDEGGHSFICDGYRTDDYFHFNWGWSGQNDGYYKLSSLTPGSGGAGGGGYDFSEDQDVLIGIVPDKKDLPKVIVTWSVKGVKTTTEFTQEDPLVLPANPANCSDAKVFVGWTESSTVSGTKPADLFTTAAGKTVMEAVTYYAVFADKEGEAPVTDQLTLATTGVSGTQYTEWSGKSVTSPAVYAGNSAGGNSAIQLRSSGSNSGIVTTASGGEISKVSVVWNNNTTTTAERKIDIYGSNTAYTAASDLYGGSKGTKLGSITYNTSTELSISGNYAYVGVRSNSGALYLDAITFSWGGQESYKNYSLTCSTTDIEEVSNKKPSTKVLINGQLYIQHGENMYTVTGARVK